MAIETALPLGRPVTLIGGSSVLFAVFLYSAINTLNSIPLAKDYAPAIVIFSAYAYLLLKFAALGAAWLGYNWARLAILFIVAVSTAAEFIVYSQLMGVNGFKAVAMVGSHVLSSWATVMELLALLLLFLPVSNRWYREISGVAT